jgi:hypothetical protein
VKYADDIGILAKEEMMLRGMIDRLTANGKYYGMEMNVEKTKVLRISRQPSPVLILIGQKQLENVEYFNYLGSMTTNDGRCTREIKSRIFFYFLFTVHLSISIHLLNQRLHYYN